jgi:hypothetical protein
VPNYLHEANVDVRVTLDGVPYGASWDSAQGGNLEGNNVKYRPGSMGDELSFGGPASRSDLTVAIQMSDIVASWIPVFESRAGSGVVTVVVTFLDAEKLPLSSITRKGTLKNVQPPDMDGSNSSPGRAIFQIVVDCNERAA